MALRSGPRLIGGSQRHSVEHVNPTPFHIKRPMTLDNLRQDVRLAIRSLLRAPAFAVVTI